MSEKQLTEDQIKRINKVKEAAIRAVENIPERPNRHIFDGGHTEPYWSIGKKAIADIQAIMEE